MFRMDPARTIHWWLPAETGTVVEKVAVPFTVFVPRLIDLPPTVPVTVTVVDPVVCTVVVNVALVPLAVTEVCIPFILALGSWRAGSGAGSGFFVGAG